MSKKLTAEEKHAIEIATLMREYAEYRLKAIASRIQEKDTEITNAIQSQKQEGREVPDWLKGQRHAYKKSLEAITEHLQDDNLD